MLEIVLLIAVIVLAVKIHTLRDEISIIKQQISELLNAKSHDQVIVPLKPNEKRQPVSPKVQPAISTTQTVLPPPKTAQPNPVAEPEPYFEKVFSIQYSVWIGAIAIAMAGFYLAQYSIQNGLLSPQMRLFLGLILGMVCIFAGNWVHQHPDIANAKRISQALVGAGVAALYACLFAASSSMYAILPDVVIIIALTILTLSAAVMALKIGMPIAIIGMVGGFLIPVFFGVHSVGVPLLSAHVYVISAMLLLCARRRGWWLLALIATLFGTTWLGYIMLSAVASNLFATNIAGLFLLALTVTAIWSVSGIPVLAQRELKFPMILIYCVLGLPLIIFCVLQTYMIFNLIQWTFIALFVFASLLMSYYDQKNYGYAPFITLVVLFMLLLNSSMLSPGLFAATLTGFAVVYGVFGFFAQWRAEDPKLFAALSSVSSLGFYLIAYYNLNTLPIAQIIPGTFCYVAAFLAIFYVGALWEVLQRWPKHHPQREMLLAIYTCTVTAFISLAIAVQSPGKFYPIAFSLQFLAMTWVYQHLRIKIMDQLILVVGAIPVYLISMQLLMLVYSPLGGYSMKAPNLIVLQFPLLQLGLPSLCFLIGGIYFSQTNRTEWGNYAIQFALMCIAFLVYILMRQAFHPSFVGIRASMLEHALINHALIALALAYLVVGLFAHWPYMQPCLKTFTEMSDALLGLVLLRIVWFEAIYANPVLTNDGVGTYPIANLLTFALLSPWLVYYGVSYLMQREKPATLQGFYHFLELVLMFVWVTLSIRQLFHGTTLDIHEVMTNAEIISYSIGWILFGIALVFVGALQKNKELRIAGLVMMTIAIGKVFLFDASSLEGLLRVLSFLGLGISLIGIGWFSARFVIPDDKPPVSRQHGADPK